MFFDKKMSTFDEFSSLFEEKENKSESMRNYKAYLAGKEPLRHVVINHREGDSAYDFVKSQLTHNFSVFPEGHWERVRKKYRKEIDDMMGEKKLNN